MAETKRLPIDLGELCEALDSAGPELVWYLDLETGDLLFVSSFGDDPGKLAERIESEPERYEGVPALESHEAYQDMEDFIQTVKDRYLVGLLEVAIDGKGAFRRFKNVLARFPDEQERWFRFKDARLRSRALQWLEEIGVQPA